MNQEISIPANHFRKLNFFWNLIMNIFALNFLNPYGYADGGKIIIFNNNFMFKPHFFNTPGGRLEFNLNEIKKVVKNPGVVSQVKNISIFLKENREERFVIYTTNSDNLLKILK